MQVHLCANNPCNDPGAAAVHIACSVAVSRTAEYDLQEMAGRGPWRRAWRVAVWVNQSMANGDPRLDPPPVTTAPRPAPPTGQGFEFRHRH